MSGGYNTVARYNNTAGRTLDDILAAIAKAKALANSETRGGDLEVREHLLYTQNSLFCG